MLLAEGHRDRVKHIKPMGSCMNLLCLQEWSAGSGQPLLCGVPWNTPSSQACVTCVELASFSALLVWPWSFLQKPRKSKGPRPGWRQSSSWSCRCISPQPGSAVLRQEEVGHVNCACFCTHLTLHHQVQETLIAGRVGGFQLQMSGQS